jgi:hypothetical protein
MTIQISSQIVNYPLTNLDSGVAVEESEAGRKQINQHYPHTGRQEESLW